MSISVTLYPTVTHSNTRKVVHVHTHTHHCLNVLQLVEQHQFDSEDGVIVCPHVTHIVVELVGDMTELCELVAPRNEPAGVGRVRAMPLKLMEPELCVHMCVCRA